MELAQAGQRIKERRRGVAEKRGSVIEKDVQVFPAHAATTSAKLPMGGGKEGGGVNINESSKKYKAPVISNAPNFDMAGGAYAQRGKVKNGVVLCPRHWRKVARITSQGVELWCKSDRGHPVLVAYEDIAEQLK